MCGRFSLDRYPTSIIKALIDAEIAFTASGQVYPTNEVAVAIRTDDGNEIAQMKWGWERSFSKQPLINTRSEEAWGKKTWSKAMYANRCIIPASGFFEWNQNQPRGTRDRYKISPFKADGFAFGGLYEINSETGEMFMSILTTAPNKKMAKIHHRMPVILEQDEFNNWFDSEDRVEVEQMMQPVDDDGIDVRLDA